MDKNTITGFSLIFLVILAFSFFSSPSQEQLEAQRRYNDSVAKVAKLAENEAMQNKESMATADSMMKANPDSAKSIYGDFAQSLSGNNQTIVLENELIKVEFESKGAAPAKVTLKEHLTYDKQPLVLFEGKDHRFDFELPANGNVIHSNVLSSFPLHTEDLYFIPSSVTDSSVSFCLKIGKGSLVFDYKLPANSYMLDFNVTSSGLKPYFSSSNSTTLIWQSRISKKERSATFESRYASLSYKYFNDTDVDDLSSQGNDEQEVSKSLHWVAFKDQYFSEVLISKVEPFSKANLSSSVQDPESGYIQKYKAVLNSGIDLTTDKKTEFTFFFGPNKYNLLCSYDDNLKGDNQLKLNKLIPLGWALFRWVNQLIVIPIFNFLESFISNYGVIILLLTLIIKLLLFPFTYKSFMSQAKMRALKPEIDKLTKDIPAENTMERSRVTMELYSKTGVNPMGGCFPMLLSMPVLIAVFTFFPTAIELRGHSFLWADDLSAYDSILDFGVNIPFFGDHISLFCLLMTATNIVYSKFNMQMSDTGANQQMPMMKYMMYLMPVMFMFIFNDYASGLTYYYFISLLITIATTFIMRSFVDDEELLRKIQEKAAKRPADKKGMMARWQEMQQEMIRKQQEAMRQQQEMNKNK